MIPTSTENFLDEIDRVIVNVGAGVAFLGTPRYVAIAVDRASSGAAVPKLISRHSFGCEFHAQYEVFYALCEDRAQQCVDTRLRLNGRAIKPERYLTPWRRAFSQAISPNELKARCGAQLFAILGGPIARLRGIKSRWADSPFETFDDFERRSPEETFLLQLNIEKSEIARDLRFAELFFDYDIQQDERSIARLELNIEANPVASHATSSFDEEKSHVISH